MNKIIARGCLLAMYSLKEIKKMTKDEIFKFLYMTGEFSSYSSILYYTKKELIEIYQEKVNKLMEEAR